MSDEVKKRYYSISEVANMLNLSNSCVRYWGNTFGVPVGYRGGKGGSTRYFEIESVALFHHIHNLIYTQKYTIEGAKIKLREAKLI
jgi:DNA-binding transcriptional MerR regulator